MMTLRPTSAPAQELHTIQPASSAELDRVPHAPSLHPSEEASLQGSCGDSESWSARDLLRAEIESSPEMFPAYPDPSYFESSVTFAPSMTCVNPSSEVKMSAALVEALRLSRSSRSQVEDCVLSIESSSPQQAFIDELWSTSSKDDKGFSTKAIIRDEPKIWEIDYPLELEEIKLPKQIKPLPVRTKAEKLKMIMRGRHILPYDDPTFYQDKLLLTDKLLTDQPVISNDLISNHSVSGDSSHSNENMMIMFPDDCSCYSIQDESFLKDNRLQSNEIEQQTFISKFLSFHCL